MSLSDLPAINLSENSRFLIVISIVIFIFFFTKQKESDVELLKGKGSI